MSYRVVQRTDDGKFVMDGTFQWRWFAVCWAWVMAGSGPSGRRYVTTVTEVEDE